MTTAFMDDSLCQLIRDAIQQKDGSPERQRATAALALAIDQLPEIPKFLGKGWQPYYQQALTITMRDVERNIAKFPKSYKLDMASVNCQNPSDAVTVRQCFVKWVVMILKRDCQDVKRGKINQPRELSSNAPVGQEAGAKTIEDIISDPSERGIERLIEKERRFIGKELKRYIESDSENQLRNCHVRDRQDINCQVLIQKRYLQNPPLTLEKIAQDLNSSLQTIKSRLTRNCLPLLREIALKLGYE